MNATILLQVNLSEYLIIFISIELLKIFNLFLGDYMGKIVFAILLFMLILVLTGCTKELYDSNFFLTCKEGFYKPNEDGIRLAQSFGQEAKELEVYIYKDTCYVDLIFSESHLIMGNRYTVSSLPVDLIFKNE